MPHSQLVLFSDGGSRGNPGPAGIGVVIYDNQRTRIAGYKAFIGVTTNNQAEYKALLFGLEKALELGGKIVVCNLDSELIVKQLTGKYKIKHAEIKPLVAQVLAISNKFQNISFRHVPREDNTSADALVNEAIDEYEAGKA